MEMKQESTIYQIFIKLLDGKHKALNFTTPIIQIQSLKNQIQTLTLIPSHLQWLTLSNSRNLSDSESLDLHKPFPVLVNLRLRLRGGKGGFGSLLRGAATKAGQKKTNNFDACRDMSGRRLRHVNAEKKLEEWRAEAEERKLEKVAEEYIKKKDKESGGKKAKRSDAAEKYVAKYREDSAKCMEEVERTVRESLKGVLSSKNKRKGISSELNESDAKKRMKIWMGKRKVDESDSEDEDDDESDDEEMEKEKSVVIDSGNSSDSSKEAEKSPDSVTCVKPEKGGSNSFSEEEKLVEENLQSGDTYEAEAEAKMESCEERTIDSDSVNTTGSGQVNIGPNSELVQEETVSKSPEVSDLEKPLNFDDYNLPAELEVLGLERLKMELQTRGLKCGGTISERASRLFLLKTTPLEKLPKKYFAKK